jgi:putative transposase
MVSFVSTRSPSTSNVFGTRVLSCYFRYYHKSRTHLSLNKDRPVPRRVQLASAGKIVAFPEVGGMHHRYERRAA